MNIANFDILVVLHNFQYQIIILILNFQVHDKKFSSVNLQYSLNIENFIISTATNGEENITSKQFIKRSKSETFYIDFTNVDELNPTESGAEITIGKTIHLRSFCVRFYVKSMNRQKLFIGDGLFT